MTSTIFLQKPSAHLMGKTAVGHLRLSVASVIDGRDEVYSGGTQRALKADFTQ